MRDLNQPPHEIAITVNMDHPGVILFAFSEAICGDPADRFRVCFGESLPDRLYLAAEMVHIGGNRPPHIYFDLRGINVNCCSDTLLRFTEISSWLFAKTLPDFFRLIRPEFRGQDHNGEYYNMPDNEHV